ncbi:putative histidinol dehydrogenase [Colletotrichum sublineola]|uniref:Putative histidinol dehydrogenase n=1 Tax=Colletotrichum sublineola TaxID=1173701 RepID=A0A066XGZ2_COLSU|nr:putative histidinol dehydrogenase [Colletotrichum sublineola]
MFNARTKVAAVRATEETGSSVDVTALIQPGSLDKSKAHALKKRDVKIASTSLTGPKDEIMKQVTGSGVVVSVIISDSLFDQLPLSNASKKAGVWRFVPCVLASNGIAPAPSVDVSKVVLGVIDDISANGDTIVCFYSQKFDKWEPKSFKLSSEQIQDIIAKVDRQTIKDINTVQQNVRRFAQAQRDSIRDFEIKSEPGIFLGQKNIPIETVGAYILGGCCPLLSSAHMTILTAKRDLCSATVEAMFLAGCDEIFILGGVQAIATMALGTETIAKVDFIAGPGNAFVAEAQRRLHGEVGIDLVAGPTEILIVADEYADLMTVAIDLVSQAEHEKAIRYVDAYLEYLSPKCIAAVSWRDHWEVIVVNDLDEAYKVAHILASEHVQILTLEPREALQKMKQYGALFLGEKTCVSYGDEVVCENEPRFAHKKGVSLQWRPLSCEKASGELGRLCGRAARAENFEAHARSGELRASTYLQDSTSWIKTVEDDV